MSLLLFLIAFAPVAGFAATTSIYKCFDKNLGLLYTDEPCKDGEPMTIRAGDADPAALARLERARDALDLSAAQRIADARRTAALQDLAVWYAGGDPLSAYANAVDPSYVDGVTWWLPGFARAHPRRRPPEPMQSPRHLRQSLKMTARR